MHSQADLEGDDSDESGQEEQSSNDKRFGSNSIPKLLTAAGEWDDQHELDPTGWWVSEKLDGLRAFYNGVELVSRLGKVLAAPSWFLDTFPIFTKLDGELYLGPDRAQETFSAACDKASPLWNDLKFHVFDMPSHSGLFEERQSALKDLLSRLSANHPCPEIVLVEHQMATSREDVLARLKAVKDRGGEGLMLRKAESLYSGGRSSTLLKIKTFFDAEAEVMAYAGDSLECRMACGQRFTLNPGEAERPKIGAIVVYRFTEVKREGQPISPVFVGVAVDKAVAKDAVVPEQRRDLYI
ncbi:hypothetical protein C8F01DRAFT_976679 [Mycena amicta]|nr:hypothetical protein C8F01DRAFT_976679 [Mycena amicta]